MKGFLIFALLIIFTSFASAQTNPLLEVKLAEVSDSSISYYCNGCNAQPDGREGSLIWYKCSRYDSNCQVSVRRTSDDHELTVIKFNNARAYFQDKKLASIIVNPSSTHYNAVPFNIAGISIPYLSASDKINFARANMAGVTSTNPVSVAYFQKFYYEAGAPRSTFVNDRITPLGNSVKMGETLPLHLCGQEFFDITSQQVRNRNRNSWFLVEKAGPDCIVSSYRISTEHDAVWLNNNRNIGIRTYPCGKNHVYFAVQNYAGALAGTEQESELSNFECKAERDIATLRCPPQGTNNDERLLCEQQTRNILFQAGSTQYFVTGGQITVLPADMTSQTVRATSLLIDDAQSIKVFNGNNVVDVTPEDVAEIRFNGQLDDESPTAESKLLLKSGLVNIESNREIATYRLNALEEMPSFRYALVFDNNILQSVSDSSNQEGIVESTVNQIKIINLRVAQNLRQFASMQLSENNFNLYPLRGDEAEILQTSSYQKYRVRNNNAGLRDIAELYVSESTALPGGQAGSAVTDFMERIRETSGLYYEESGVPEQSRGPDGWARPDQFGVNTHFRAGNIVLVPNDGSSYQGNNGNRLNIVGRRNGRTALENAPRRAARRGNDLFCTQQLGGECQNNAQSGGACILRNNQAGYFSRGSCLSNPSSSNLCCVPESMRGSSAISGTTSQIERPGAACRARGGNCINTYPQNLENYANLDLFCASVRSDPMLGENENTNTNWKSYGQLDCRSGDNTGICCGPENQRRGSVFEREDTLCILSNGECRLFDSGFNRLPQNERDLACNNAAMPNQNRLRHAGALGCPSQRGSVGGCCIPNVEPVRQVSATTSQQQIRNPRLTKVDLKIGGVWTTLTSTSPVNSELGIERQESYNVNDLSMRENLILILGPDSLLCHVGYKDQEGQVQEKRGLLINSLRMSKSYNINNRADRQEIDNAYTQFRNYLLNTCRNAAADLVSLTTLEGREGSGITGRDYNLRIARP